MITTIEWTPVHKKLPDVETNVLLALSSKFTCEGFLDCDEDGSPIWRDVCATELGDDQVTHWAAMPVLG